MSEVASKIAGEIEERGAITFERFMTLALYCPICGYYEKEGDSIGHRGDYYTSVSVGSLLGELLAYQFAEWLEESPRWRTPRTVAATEPKTGERAEAMRIVEAGAHDGRLARDVLGWLREHRPGLFGRLEYCIVEPSERRRGWQERTLAELGARVRWARELEGLTGSTDAVAPARQTAGLRGIVFSNELLDAMPIRRLGWDANKGVWFEWGVTLRAGRFVWTRLAAEESAEGNHGSGESFPVLPWQLQIGKEVLEMLPDGFSAEVCPTAEKWWHVAAGTLKAGKLLTIDYGLTTEEILRPERKGGTLRSYRGHHPGGDVLAHPGDQDITAHVNFTAIRTAGETAGLKTDTFLTQAQFLTGIAARILENPDSFGEWTAERTRQFQTLTHPEHLGRSFRALVQSRT